MNFLILAKKGWKFQIYYLKATKAAIPVQQIRLSWILSTNSRKYWKKASIILILDLEDLPKLPFQLITMAYFMNFLILVRTERKVGYSKFTF